LLGVEALPATSLSEGNARANQIAMHEERLLDLTGAHCSRHSGYWGRSSLGRSPAHHQVKKQASRPLVRVIRARACRRSHDANLASTAAAVVVGKDGTTACSIRELREMLLTPSLSAADKYHLTAPSPVWNPTAPLDAALFYEWVF